MRAGNLRHRVTIQARSTAISDSGASTDTWANVGTVWARISPAKGKAITAGAESSGVQAFQITIRKPPHLTVDQDSRIVHAGVVYQIQDPVDPELHGERIDLICNVWRADGNLGDKV